MTPARVDSCVELTPSLRGAFAIGALGTWALRAFVVP